MSLLRWFTGKKPRVGVLLGSESTGKTSALYTLKLGKNVTTTTPTIAFNVEEIKRGSRGDFILWDIGGCDQMRNHLRPHLTPGRFVLFLHDAIVEGEWLEASLAYFRRVIALMRETGVTHMWILFTKQDLLPATERESVVRTLRSTFEAEMLKQKNELAICFVETPGLSALDEQKMHAVLDQVECSLADKSKSGAPISQAKSPGVKTQDESVLIERVKEMSADQSSPEVFWRDFQNSEISSWNHYMHLRSGYFVLLEGTASNRCVMDAADIFLGHLARLRDSNPQRFRNTAHRTMKIFWLSMLNIAALSYQQITGRATTSRYDFTEILLHAPSLMDTSIWSKHYSRDLMFSTEARDSWKYPDLQPLPASLVQPETAAQPPSRTSTDGESCLIELALAIVQINMRCRVNRGALIKYSLALLEPLTIRLRAEGHHVPPFSTSHVYFWVQLVHACLTSVDSATGQGLTSSTFMERSDVTSQEWSRYYSSSAWNDISSRTEFACPDLKSLPNRIEPGKNKLTNSHGLVEMQSIDPQQAMDMIVAVVADYEARICELAN